MMEMDREKDTGIELEDEEKRESGEADLPPQRPRRGLEGFYEHFRWIPLKYIDGFIILCILALLGVILVGALQSQGLSP